MHLQALYHDVAGEVDAVRDIVRRQWAEAFRLVYGPSATPPKLGGKLMRPALCLLSAGAAGAQELRRYVDMSAAMELLHLAALAHDD
ncbi:MAG: polyprenyl synthetase family protein, partial [Candidatus Hydrogenedentales bacterium]